MAEIKWIKLKTDMFNDDKIKLIQALPSGDAIIVIWIRMLILAGISNADGYLMVSENLPYTEEMLAIIFNKPLSVVRLALNTFEAYGMLENSGEGFYISDFSVNQSEKMQDIREYNRIKKAESRERAKQKMLELSMTCQENGQADCQEKSMTMSMTRQNECQNNVNDTSNTMSMTSQECQDTDIDKDIDIIINNNNNITPKSPDSGKQQERLDYDRIVSLYNSTCKDLPKVRGMSDERRKKIKTLLNSLDKSKILTNLGTYERLQYLFSLADESDFLSGREAPNAWCGFDWLINSKNALKVIEGNYKNKGGTVRHGTTFTTVSGIPAPAGTYTSESENDALAAFRAGKDRV